MYNIKCKGVAEESESNICDKEPQRCCGKNCWIMHKSFMNEELSGFQVSFYNHWRILENYTGTFEVPALI